MTRELDEACARAMGLDPQLVVYDMAVFTVDRQFLEKGDYCYRGDGGTHRLPFYSCDHAAARLLEDEIERRGLEESYITELCALVGDSPALMINHAMWLTLRATPEQRAHAFLTAIEAGVIIYAADVKSIRC